MFPVALNRSPPILASTVVLCDTAGSEHEARKCRHTNSYTSMSFGFLFLHVL